MGSSFSDSSFLEPIKGQRVSLEDDIVISLELSRFLLHFFRGNGFDILCQQDQFISAQLASLPINLGLGKFLKPYIKHHTGLLAREIGGQIRREFMMMFSVLASKIDLADVQECDKIRR